MGTCTDCNGTGTYVGFIAAESCKTCGGSGRAEDQKPAWPQTCPLNGFDPSAHGKPPDTVPVVGTGVGRVHQVTYRPELRQKTICWTCTMTKTHYICFTAQRSRLDIGDTLSIDRAPGPVFMFLVNGHDANMMQEGWVKTS